ncbi:cytochrome P450 [Dactylonectria macrodidyma]|uniref:Cytochrome P450 n=1 Tax=Dactylonectria macrodidyma TaxID=307937 RepID=A0A9P9FRE6_9HYPO|nr:cytochrome P450 [Dactylonectria macrodidyma]
MPPWQKITVAAAVGCVLLNWKRDGWSKSSLLGSFVALWLLGFTLWGVWVVWVYPLLLSPLRHLPEPSGNHWMMGQWFRIIREPSGMPMREWVNEIPNDGLIRYRDLFNQECILVCSPKALAEVLVTNSYAFQKPGSLRWALSRIVGIGLVLAEGDEHKFQRRNLTPAFSFRHIKDLYPIFWRKSCEVTQAMMVALGDANQLETDITSWASRSTLDMIGLAGMGKDFGAIKDKDSVLVKAYEKVFKPSKQAQMMALAGLLLPTWLIDNLPIRRNDDINVAADEIRAVCRDLIPEKRAKLRDKAETGVDILSVALESGAFTDENLVDQLMTFLAAGHETTATAITWAMYTLARYPDVQSRLREEIRRELPSVDSDADITSQDIDRLPYLNAVCNEVLRYWAPVPITIRDTAHDTTIGGQVVPKGTLIMVSPWATNHDRSLWGANADTFDPERWISSDKTKAKSGGSNSNYAFLSFLHGPRGCIGASFSRAEIACLLAAWVGRFEFELRNPEDFDEKNLVIKSGFTSGLADGCPVTMRVASGN